MCTKINNEDLFFFREMLSHLKLHIVLHVGLDAMRSTDTRRVGEIVLMHNTEFTIIYCWRLLRDRLHVLHGRTNVFFRQVVLNNNTTTTQYLVDEMS